MADLTLAIAGHAPNTARNIEALLADWLDLGAPDADGYYDKPERFKTITVYALLTDSTIPAGLKPALKVLPYIDGVRFEIVTDSAKGEIAKWAESADNLIVALDPFEALIEALGDGKSPRLLINWDDSDADDERLVQLAHEHGKIKVLDLVEGLVEIVPDEDPEPEPEPEPAPRKRTRKPETLDKEPEELDDAPPPAPTPEPVADEPAPASESQEPAQLTVPIADTYTFSRDLAEQVYGALVVASDYLNYADCMAALREGRPTTTAERSALTQDLTNVAELVRAVIFGEEPYEQNAPKKTAAPKPGNDKPVRVIWDEDSGEWKRAGRGRVRVGTRVGLMDADGNVTESQ